MSKAFFDLISEICHDNYPRMSFAEVYWTVHSMYCLVFSLLLRDWPEADIFHAVSTGYAGIIASYAAFYRNSKLLLTEHGIYTREREEEIIKADWVRGYAKNLWIDYFNSLSQCIYNCADLVISLFERNQKIQEELGCPAVKAKVIHNGINVDSFSSIVSSCRISDRNAYLFETAPAAVNQAFVLAADYRAHSSLFINVICICGKEI
jgi:glycosyltransferase involved in cell wall biosynthesis